jgi:hypothetical protein
LKTCLVILCLFSFSIVSSSKSLIRLTEENWKDVLKGEWMLEFHAPWCPACKDLSKAWESFADWSKDLEINVAEIDVTANPGLSGRFLVTALPTIYHVKDGVFRTYAGPRDKDDFMVFIEQKKWTVVDSVPGWKYPDSPQMSIVAMFFRLSMQVRDFHNYLIEEKGWPSWASYLLFGGATLILGCLLGFLIVCLIDFLFPATGPTPIKDTKKQKQKSDEKAKDSQSEGDSQTQSDEDEEEEESDEQKARQRKKGEKGKDKKTPNGKPAGSPEGKKKK